MPRSNFDAWLHGPKSAVAIVGATGWVGQAMLHAVLESVPDIAPERLRLFTSAPRALAMAGRAFETEALDPSTVLGDGRWLVVHAGVVGGDASPGGRARWRNDALLEEVLRISAGAEVERLVLVSSGAAGFADEAPPAKAAYARMKRDHEIRARDWSAAAGHRLLVPRIFNLGGPYMTWAQNYALGDFIQRLSKDRRLTIGAAHPVFRSYVHVLEMAKTLFAMAVDEAEGAGPFDVMGGQIVELGELARVAKLALGALDAEIVRPTPKVDACDWYVGDGRRYRTALFKAGGEPTPLSTIVMDTVNYLRAAQPL